MIDTLVQECLVMVFIVSAVILEVLFTVSVARPPPAISQVELFTVTLICFH